jgi:hypothetical protein
MKQLAVAVAADKLAELIDARRRYNAFKARRFRHGFTHLGEVVERAAADEGETCQQMVRVIGHTKEHLDEILAGQPVPALAPMESPEIQTEWEAPPI